MIPVSPRQRVGMGTGKSICSAMIQYLILCYATECDRMCVRVMVSPPFPISEWVFGFLCQELKLGGGGGGEQNGRDVRSLDALSIDPTALLSLRVENNS